ncbi:MAG TPA: hypothetical protein VN688_01405 [Gemmataceae bacterium]|nr:hypothetical protein [Gemmataceae bacterium]
MEQDKRRYRQLKRDLKRAGSRKRRRHLQRELLDHPEEAGQTDFDFGRDSTAGLNGIDRDSTRHRMDRSEDRPTGFSTE